MSVVLLSSHANGNPLRSDPKVFINEISINQAERGFIEIHAPEGFSDDFFRNQKLGLAIIEPKRTHPNNVLRFLIDLENLRKPLTGDAMFYLVGNPVTSRQPSQSSYLIDLVLKNTRPPSFMKIFGLTEKWLDVGTKDLFFVFLTSSSVSRITEEFQPDLVKRNVAYLEDQKDLENYIINNQIDYGVIRGQSSTISKCNQMERCINEELLTFGRLRNYVPVPASPLKSINRCGIGYYPATNKVFKEGAMTPGAINDCSSAIVQLRSSDDALISLEPSSTTHEGDTCFKSDEELFSTLGGDQINVQAQTAVLAAANSPNVEVCEAPDRIRNDVSGELSEKHRLELERIKLLKYLTNTCDDEPYVRRDPTLILPSERERIRDATYAVNFIKDYLTDYFNEAEIEFIMDILEEPNAWFQLNINYVQANLSTWNCFFCSNAPLVFPVRLRSGPSSMEGVLYPKGINLSYLRSHMNSPEHKYIMQMLELNKKVLLREQISTDLQRTVRPEFETTNHHFEQVK